MYSNAYMRARILYMYVLELQKCKSPLDFFLKFPLSVMAMVGTIMPFDRPILYHNIHCISIPAKAICLMSSMRNNALWQCFAISSCPTVFKLHP